MQVAQVLAHPAQSGPAVARQLQSHRQRPHCL